MLWGTGQWMALFHLPKGPRRHLLASVTYWASPSSSAGKRIQLQFRRSWFDSCVGKFAWRRDRLPTPVLLGFPDSSDGKESTCNAGDLGSTPGLGRSPGEGKGYPLQYSGLENSMGHIVHGVAKSRTRLSNFHSLTHWTLSTQNGDWN